MVVGISMYTMILYAKFILNLKKLYLCFVFVIMEKYISFCDKLLYYL